MTITRFYPTQNAFESLYHQGSQAPATGFVPAADIYEDEKKIVLSLEVPGVEENALNVSVDNHVLTVKGERKLAEETKQENFRRIERSYGSFTRSFRLGETVDAENIAASYNAGVLKLDLPKKAEATPRQIKIGTTASAAVNQAA